MRERQIAVCKEEVSMSGSAKEIALKTVGITATAILSFVILFLAVVLLNSRFHFWY